MPLMQKTVVVVAMENSETFKYLVFLADIGLSYAKELSSGLTSRLKAVLGSELQSQLSL